MHIGSGFFLLAFVDTGAACTPQVQAASQSAGQTLPVNSGKLWVLCQSLVCLIHSAAVDKLVYFRYQIVPGQPDAMPAIIIPAWEKGTPQSIHLSACLLASSTGATS